LFTNNTAAKKFLWGLDLSGSEQGAGGVGGLLKVWDYYTANHCFVGYDGNGNVAVLTLAHSGEAGQARAQFEYGPFGEPIRSSGTTTLAANDHRGMPFRFSTKYTDQESDLVYYGYRYYNPSTGSWPNRDLIGELGGHNLYGFVSNDALSKWDRLGLCTCGPDVTRPLQRALMDVQVKFWGWTQTQKQVACERLVSYIDLKAFDAWELEPLYTWGTADIVVAFGSSGKRCYYASAVNYSLWGVANRICYEAAKMYDWRDANGPRFGAWSLDRSLLWARVWKGILGDDSDRAAQAYAFTRYGYTGTLMHPGVPGLAWDGRHYRGEIEWLWEPYKSKPKN
jgi:RHS repeat-associated protein